MQDASGSMALRESPVWLKVRTLIRALDNALLASNGGADQESLDDAVVLSGILYEIVCEEDQKDAKSRRLPD